MLTREVYLKPFQTAVMKLYFSIWCFNHSAFYCQTVTGWNLPTSVNWHWTWCLKAPTPVFKRQPQKWPNTLKQCVGFFGFCVGLVLKRLGAMNFSLANCGFDLTSTITLTKCSSHHNGKNYKWLRKYLVKFQVDTGDGIPTLCTSLFGSPNKIFVWRFSTF